MQRLQGNVIGLYHNTATATTGRLTQATNATSFCYWDCAGLSEAKVLLFLNSDHTTAPSAVLLKHGDSTSFTSCTNVSGCVGGTDFTIPALTAGCWSVYQFDVNMAGKGRYLHLGLTPAATGISAEAVLIGTKKTRSADTTSASGIGSTSMGTNYRTVIIANG